MIEMDSNEKISCVYGIKDLRNDKVIYIGQTKDFEIRKQNHFCKNINPIDLYMYNENRDNFEMFIIEELPDSTLEERAKREDDLILQYNTIENGFNKHRSGMHGAERIKEVSKAWEESHKEQRKKQHIIWYEKNRETRIEQCKIWNKNNKERVNAASRRYREKKRREKQNMDNQ